MMQDRYYVRACIIRGFCKAIGKVISFMQVGCREKGIQHREFINNFFCGKRA